MASNLTIWEYPYMDPSKSIVGISGLVKAMPALYGPNFDSTVFTPLFDNIRTSALMSKPHHCTHKDTKGHKMTRRCVTEGHQSYCLEWDDDEAGRRVRCGQRHKVESSGCGKHPARLQCHSNNLLVKNLIAGKIDSIEWSQLNDPKKVAENVSSQEPTGNQTTQAILAQHEEVVENLDTIGALPAVNQDAYCVHITFNEHSIQRGRVEAEERKLKAAARKSGAAGKSDVTGKSGFTGKLKKLKETVLTSKKDPQVTEREKKRSIGSAYGKSGAKKNGRPDPSVFQNKRGGRNIADLPA